MENWRFSTNNGNEFIVSLIINVCGVYVILHFQTVPRIPWKVSHYMISFGRLMPTIIKAS